jgi:hypothetical protein
MSWVAEDCEGEAGASAVDAVEKAGDIVVIKAKTLTVPMTLNNITNTFLDNIKFLQTIGSHNKT